MTGSADSLIARVRRRVRDTFEPAPTRAVALLRVSMVTMLWLRWGRVTLAAKTYEHLDQLLAGQLFLLFSTLTFFGILTRWSCLATAATLYYLVDAGVHAHSQGIDVPATYYWLFPLLLATTDCGRSLSIDRWWVVRAAKRSGASIPPETGMTAGAIAICMLVSAAHLDAAWARWESLPDALDPMRRAAEREGAFGAAHLSWLVAAAYVAPITGAIVALGLWIRRLRLPVMIGGSLVWTGLWLGGYVFALPALLMAGYVAFLDPRRVDEVVEKLVDPESPHARAGSPGPTTDRKILVVRGVLFALVVAWMVIPPVTYHLIDVPIMRKNKRYVRPWFSKGWVMMHGRGMGICALDFYTGSPEEPRPANRYEILGYEGVADAPKAIKRIHRGQLYDHIRRVCAAVDPDVTLYLRSFCAGRNGWYDVQAGDEDVCDGNDFPKRGTWRPSD